MIKVTFLGEEITQVENIEYDKKVADTFTAYLLDFDFREEVGRNFLFGDKSLDKMLVMLYQSGHGGDFDEIKLEYFVDKEKAIRTMETSAGLDALYGELGTWPKVVEWFGLKPSVGGVRNAKNWKKGKKPMPQQHFEKMKKHLEG